MSEEAIWDDLASGKRFSSQKNLVFYKNIIIEKK